MTSLISSETIVAIATPPGYGGVGVVRLSGERAHEIALSITGKETLTTQATLCDFHFKNNLIDQGLVLGFRAPRSFTGEDVIEFQGHGSPWALTQLLEACQHHGARMAQPGEFSKRAFLNGKLHLNEAEAIADLIHASSAQAAQSALQSLKGVFAEEVNALMKALRSIRIFLEASLDFSDEDITLLEQETYQNQLAATSEQLKKLRGRAEIGMLQQIGLTMMIGGHVNVGKSSLLNALSDENVAIVSDIAGTTRDMIKNSIHIDGLPIHLLDTAGWRDATDSIEKEGQRRAKDALDRVNVLLWVSDHGNIDQAHEDRQMLSLSGDCIYVMNKVDLRDGQPRVEESAFGPVIHISAEQGLGLDLLRDAIKHHAGYHNHREGVFIARRRHCEALDQAQVWISQALEDMQAGAYPECVAQSCTLAHQSLASITGRADVEDLLEGIFSEFCIGK